MKLFIEVGFFVIVGLFDALHEDFAVVDFGGEGGAEEFADFEGI